MTYGELDVQSNRVAKFLMAEGIQIEDRIGIFMDRSTDMIVAMLGILKAGGTYLPIDIKYPEERLRFLAEDAELRLVLTQKAIHQSFPFDRTVCLCRHPRIADPKLRYGAG